MKAKVCAPGFEGRAGSGLVEAEGGTAGGVSMGYAEWEFFFGRPGRAVGESCIGRLI